MTEENATELVKWTKIELLGFLSHVVQKPDRVIPDSVKGAGIVRYGDYA